MYKIYLLTRKRHAVFEYVSDEHDGSIIPERVRLVIYEETEPTKQILDIMESTPEMMVGLAKKHYDMLIKFSPDTLEKLKPKPLTFKDKVEMVSNGTERDDTLEATTYFIDDERFHVGYREYTLSSITLFDDGQPPTVEIVGEEEYTPVHHTNEIRFYHTIEIK